MAAFAKYLGKTENVKKLQDIFPIMITTCISAHRLGEPEPMFMVDGAQAGIEGKGRLAQAVAAISRVASVHRAAVAVLVPLTRRNCMDVKSPATGVFEAADAVWEVYDVRDSSAKCVCTHRGGVSGFDVPLARRQAGPRPAADPPAPSE